MAAHSCDCGPPPPSCPAPTARPVQPGQSSSHTPQASSCAILHMCRSPREASRAPSRGDRHIDRHIASLCTRLVVAPWGQRRAARRVCPAAGGSRGLSQGRKVPASFSQVRAPAIVAATLCSRDELQHPGQLAFSVPVPHIACSFAHSWLTRTWQAARLLREEWCRCARQAPAATPWTGGRRRHPPSHPTAQERPTLLRRRPPVLCLLTLRRGQCREMKRSVVGKGRRRGDSAAAETGVEGTVSWSSRMGATHLHFASTRPP